MGEIINKISFNGTSYDISIPHGTVNALQGASGSALVSVPSLPSIGQMITITFNIPLEVPYVVFQTDTEVSSSMAITYKNRIIGLGYSELHIITTGSTYLFVVTKDPNDPENQRTVLSLIGGIDEFMGSHASERTSYGVGTTNMYGHVKTITGDVSTITSHKDGVAAAAYHTHSNYKRTFYLSSVITSEEYGIDDFEVVVTTDISFQVNDELSYDLENGDVLIFPMTTEPINYTPNVGYYRLSRLTITTPSGEQTFSFSTNRFLSSVTDYNLICVVEKDTQLRVLNPVGNVENTKVLKAYNADTISTTRYIDGFSFNGSSNVKHYGVCTVFPNLAIKNVSIPGLTAITGAIARVKFMNAHTVTSTAIADKARLVLNNASYSTENDVGVIRNLSTGVCLPSTQSWAPGQILEMIYDGTYWNIISPYITHSGLSSLPTGSTS